MMIEERIAALEEIVRGMHAKMGHVWYRGRSAERHGGGWKECACGASEFVTEGYGALPQRYDLESDY